MLLFPGADNSLPSCAELDKPAAAAPAESGVPLLYDGGMSNIDTLRYPVGEFSAVMESDASMRAKWIDENAAAPGVVADLVAGMTPGQMKTSYRQDGWTAAQVVHHLADSHVNAYIRTRFVLAEDNFTVKPYDEKRWAEFVDATDPDVSSSLHMLRGLHARWATLLRTLGPDHFSRQLRHPERGPMTLDTLVQLYAWHGRHHAGHLKIIRGQA